MKSNSNSIIISNSSMNSLIDNSVVLCSGNNDTTMVNPFLPEKLISYIDFVLKIMNIDMDYEIFTKMSPEEKVSFLRDIKINKIL